jgi:hypothetical protein
MDEYNMSWSDANRVKEHFRRTDPDPDPAENPDEFGTLGRALWQERSLVRMLRMKLVTRADDAQTLIADLSCASALEVSSEATRAPPEPW